MRYTLRYPLMILFAVIGTAGSHALGRNEWLAWAGAVMGAMAGATVARLPGATSKLAVGLCVALLLVGYFVPWSSKTIYFDGFSIGSPHLSVSPH